MNSLTMILQSRTLATTQLGLPPNWEVKQIKDITRDANIITMVKGNKTSSLTT